MLSGLSQPCPHPDAALFTDLGPRVTSLVPKTFGPTASSLSLAGIVVLGLATACFSSVTNLINKAPGSTDS